MYNVNFPYVSYCVSGQKRLKSTCLTDSVNISKPNVIIWVVGNGCPEIEFWEGRVSWTIRGGTQGQGGPDLRT